MVITISNVPIIWVMGCPGSGKSTQCEKIDKKYGFKHLDPCALVQKEIDAQTTTGCKFQALRNDGKDVPLEEILPLLQNETLTKHIIKGFVIDGYPRQRSETYLLEEHFGPPHLIICLEVKQQTLESRKSQIVNNPRESVSNYQRETKSILQQYLKRTVQIDGDRDPNGVFSDIVQTMDVVMRVRPGASVIIHIDH